MDDREPRPRGPHQALTRSESVARGRPGARWWMYQRPPAGDKGGDTGDVEADAEAETDADVGEPSDAVTPMLPGAHRAAVAAPRSRAPNGTGSGNGGRGAASAIVPPIPSAGVRSRERPERPEHSEHLGVLARPRPQNGVALGAVAVLLFFIMWAGHKAGNDDMMVFMVPPIAIVGAVAFGRRCARLYPDEPWLPKYLVVGVIAKLVASYLRYLVLAQGYEGVGDATEYDQRARLVVNGWHGIQPSYELKDLRKSNFITWFTSVLYDQFGAHLVGAYLFFAALAIIGAYCWYRATADAVPFINKRLYLALILFMPSILFWPAALGKEALMLVGLGVLALATAKLLQGQLVKAAVFAAGGGWLVWVVRAHLLAMVTLAGSVAYFFGRVRKKDGRGTVTSRPLGMILLGFLVVFTVTQAMDSLGLQDLSQTSIEQELDVQTAKTQQGHSKIEHAPNTLSPLSVPQGAVTVLLRPFPWEAESSFQLLSSAESAFLIVLMVLRFGSLRESLRRCRGTPFLLYCWILILLYCVAFSSFANLGLLTRARSLVLPALYVLIAVDPSKAGKLDEERSPTAVAEGGA